MQVVEVDMSEIVDWDSFHSVFANALGFPDSYGPNMNAWIDCLTYENDGMTAYPVDAGGVLTLQLTAAAGFALVVLRSTKLSSTARRS